LGDEDKLPYGSDTSSAMTKHIQRHHPTIVIEKPLSKKQEVVEQQLRQLYIQAKANGDTDEFHLEVLGACLNDEVVLEALITLIVVRNLSYNLVEWVEFHTLCQALNKACIGRILTSYSTVYIKTEDAWKKHKHTVRIKLQAAISHIHIALDIWTSPNRYLFLAICAYFTTYEQKKEKALLALKEVPGHSGEDQFSILLPVLQDYGIELKLGAIIADNTSPNNVLCRIIEKYIWDIYKKEWLADY